MINQLDDSFSKQVEAQAKYCKEQRLKKEQDEKILQDLMHSTGLSKEETIKLIQETQEENLRKTKKAQQLKLKIFIASVIALPTVSFILLPIFRSH